MTPAVLGVVLTGCGGGGGSHSDTPSTPSTSATIAASLGRIYNAALEARCMATGTVLGSGSTGSSGLPTLTLSGTCSGPVVVELLANGSTTYFDEKLEATASMPAGTSLRAIVPTFSAGSALSIAVTPLTEMAARQAIAAAGSESAVTSAQAGTANSAVLAQLFGSGVNFDILTPPTVVDSSSAANSLGTTTADRYAFYLAALAHLGSGSTPALAVASALATDLADGTLDGQSTTGLTYTSDGFATQRDTALTSAAAAYASTALQTDLGIQPLAPVDVTGISPTSGAVGDDITISGTGFDTDPYHLEVKFYNNVAAEVVSATATTIVVRVPAGAATGAVTVRHIVSDTTDTSSTFTVTGGGTVTPTTWTVRANPSSYLLHGIAQGNGTFVAVGEGATIMTTTDGVSWTSQSGPDANFMAANAVTWDGAQFVLVGNSSNLASYPPIIATSANGVTWTRQSWTRGTETQLVDIVGTSNRLTAVGTTTVITSTDGGTSWSSETLPGNANVLELFSVADSGGIRIVTGRSDTTTGVILINSGTGWTVANSPTNFIPRDVTWTGSLFVAVGANSVNWGATPVVMYSTDGTNWTRVDVPSAIAPAGYMLRDVIWSNSKLYAVGDDPSGKGRVIITSTDAATWTQAHQSAVPTGNGILEGIAASSSAIVTVGGTKSITAP